MAQIFDRWSNSGKTHDTRRASREKELLEFLKEALPWRKSPILWHVPSLLLLFAPRRHHHHRTSRCPHGLQLSRLRSFLLTICILAPKSTTYSLSSGSFVDVTGVPILPRASRMQLGLSLWACKCFGKVPSLAPGTSLLSFNLFMGPALKFHSVGTSPMKNFDLYFPSDGPFFSRILAWRSVDWVNRTRRIGPNTFLHRVSQMLVCLVWETNASESCETQPKCGTIFTIATAFLSSFSLLLCEWSPFFGFLYGCSSTSFFLEQTHFSGFASRFCFVKLTLWKMPISTKRSRAITLQIVSARLSNNGTMVTFASHSSFPRHTSTSWQGGSERVAALWSGFCARSSLSCRKLHWSPFEHWPLSWRQRFVIEISD